MARHGDLRAPVKRRARGGTEGERGGCAHQEHGDALGGDREGWRQPESHGASAAVVEEGEDAAGDSRRPGSILSA